MKSREPNSNLWITMPPQILIDGEIRPEDNLGKFGPGSNIVLAKQRSSKPMRFFERLLIFCVFSLTLGVFFNEVPELISLYDDPSDDFVSSSSMPSVGSIQTVRQNSTPVRDAAPNTPLSNLPAVHSAVPAFPTGSDLLRLLTIQRK